MPAPILVPKKLNFSRDPMILEIETTLMDGAAPPYSPTEDNLRCLIKLKKQASDDIFYDQVKLAPSYSRTTKRTTVDLSGLIDDLTPPLPATTVFQPSPGTPTTHEENWGAYRATWSDQYGTPPGILAIASTQTFVVIRGSSPRWYGFGPDIATDNQEWFLLHSYVVHDGEGFHTVQKPITKTQPEPIYIFINAAVTITRVVDILYDDGTTDQLTEDFAFAIQRVVSLHCSYEQLGIATAAGSKRVISYKVTFSGGGGSTKSIHYLVDDSPNDYEYYLFYENGCGGMESVRFSGRHKKNASVERDVIRSPRWKASNHKEGLTSTINHRGGHVLDLQSGYYNKEYIQHLEQLLYSDVWLCDFKRLRYEKYTVETTSLSLTDDLQLKQNIQLTIRPAVTRTSANTFGL